MAQTATLVLDFDDTIYEADLEFKPFVLRRLISLLMEMCRIGNESESECLARLYKQHKTTSLFLILEKEGEFEPEPLLEQTYVAGFLESEATASLRIGIHGLLAHHQSATVLTNAPPVWVEYISRQLGIIDYIDEIFGVTKSHPEQKPDIAAYRQIAATQVTFIDDKLENCVAATTCGWNSFWFPRTTEAPTLTRSTTPYITNALQVLQPGGISK